MKRWLLLAGLLLACEARQSDPIPKPARPAASAPAASAAPVGPSHRYPAAVRLVAIGDLHGDLQATRAALRLAGAIDGSDRWIGGKLVVVQTGDQIDRGDDDREVLDLLSRLEGEAQAAGGALHVLIGNHEVLNVVGDYRYVSERATRAFGGEAGRRQAFAPGGEYARRLAQHDTVAWVGDTVFVHGGLLPAYVREGLDPVNTEMSRWMRGETPLPNSVMSQDSPIWSRLYSEGDPGARGCGRLAEVLSALGAARMVVGHTLQEKGINPGCGGRVWRVDAGMSRAYGGHTQVLEIQGGSVRRLVSP